MSFKKKVVIINVLSEMAINQNISIKVMCISVSRDTNDNYHKGREGGVQRVMTEIILSEEMIMVEHPLSYIFDVLVVSCKKKCYTAFKYLLSHTVPVLYSSKWYKYMLQFSNWGRLNQQGTRYLRHQSMHTNPFPTHEAALQCWPILVGTLADVYA